MRSLWICVSILFLSKPSSLSINPTVNLQWPCESCIGRKCSLSLIDVWVTLNASGVMSIDGTSSNGTSSNPMLQEERSSGQTGVCCFTCRQTIEYNSSPRIYFGSYLAKYSEILNITFEFKQPENGGGLCHCVGISFTGRDKIFK